MTRIASANRITLLLIILLTALALVYVYQAAPRNLALVLAVHAIDPAQRSRSELSRAEDRLDERLERARGDAAPADAVLWRALGLVHEAQAQREEAVAAWRRDPTSAVFLLNRGLLAEYRGEAEAALRWYGYAAELAPHEAAPWYRLAAVYENSGDLPAAEANYRQAAALAHANRDIWFGLARVLLDQDKPNAALDALQQGADGAVGRIGRSAFHFQMGRIYERNMEPPDLVNAEAAYRRAAELDDFEAVQNWRALSHYRLGEILVARGDDLQAVDHFERAIELKPDFYEAMLARSASLLHLGETQDAIAALEAGIELNPRQAAPYRALADLYESLGDDARAKELRKRAAEFAAP